MSAAPTTAVTPTPTTAAKDAVRFRWSDLPEDRPMEKIVRRRVIGSQVMVSEVRLTKGFKLASHHHENEQMTVMLEGRILFGLGQEGTPAWRTMEVKAGEVLHLPGNTPHSAEALEDVVALDIFSPPSEKTGVDRE